MVGGGIRNELLCQFVASATGKKVITGPVEATACGNILMQARAAGQIESLSAARDIVRRSFQPRTFEPQDVTIWNEHYGRMEAKYEASR
jgi:rhamnulokinase